VGAPGLEPGDDLRVTRSSTPNGVYNSDYSHDQTSNKFAAHAIISAISSATCNCQPDVLRIVPMTENIRRFYAQSLGRYFCCDLELVNDSGPAGALAVATRFRPDMMAA
jgi:hypothetical protein